MYRVNILTARHAAYSPILTPLFVNSRMLLMRWHCRDFILEKERQYLDAGEQIDLSPALLRSRIK